jgi:hypothetical protein
MNHYPRPLAEAIHDEVGSETVLWSDGPVAWDYRRRNWAKLPTAIFFLVVAAGCLWITVRAPRAGLVLVPFALVNLYIAAAPYLPRDKPRDRLQTIHYVITDRRLIVFENDPSPRIRSLDASSVESYELNFSDQVSGDLILYRRVGSGAAPLTLQNLESLAPAETALLKMMPTPPRSISIIH